MSIDLQSISLDDLRLEIQRRQESEKNEIRARIAEYRKEIAALETQISRLSGSAPAPTTSRSSLPRIPSGERSARVLQALDGLGTSATIGEIAARVGFEGFGLQATLQDLVNEGRLIREGRARGTRYRLSA